MKEVVPNPKGHRLGHSPHQGDPSDLAVFHFVARSKAGATRAREGSKLGLQMCSDQIHPQPVLSDADAQSSAAHAIDGYRGARRTDIVDVERRTGRKIHYLRLLVHRVLRDERNPDST